MPFEVFTKRTAAASGQAYVSIQKKGIFAFNHAAYALLGEPEAVEFLFDRKRQVVGVRRIDPMKDHAYPVRRNSRGTSHLVTGTLFAKHYGIASDEARRWPARMEEDTLCISVGDDPV